MERRENRNRLLAAVAQFKTAQNALIGQMLFKKRKKRTVWTRKW